MGQGKQSSWGNPGEKAEAKATGREEETGGGAPPGPSLRAAMPPVGAKLLPGAGPGPPELFTCEAAKTEAASPYRTNG